MRITDAWLTSNDHRSGVCVETTTRIMKHTHIQKQAWRKCKEMWDNWSNMTSEGNIMAYKDMRYLYNGELDPGEGTPILGHGSIGSLFYAPSWSDWSYLSAEKISLSLSHLVPDILWPEVCLMFHQNVLFFLTVFKQFVSIFSLIFDPIDPSIFIDLRSFWHLMFTKLWIWLYPILYCMLNRLPKNVVKYHPGWCTQHSASDMGDMWAW